MTGCWCLWCGSPTAARPTIDRVWPTLKNLQGREQAFADLWVVSARFAVVRMKLFTLDERLVLAPQLAKLLPPAP